MIAEFLPISGNLIIHIYRSLATTLIPDLLLIIAHLAYPDLASQPASKSNFMNMTQVCRHWRHTFISFPRFWTKIEIPHRSVSFLDELLTRSADYPIDVTVDLKYSVNVMGAYLDVLSSHMHHIRRLIIREESFNHRVNHLNYVFRLINRFAPMLKVFHFDMFSKTWPGQDYLHSSPSIVRGEVLENLFDGMAPALQELHISCMRISHRMPIFKSVTRLYLKHVWGITRINHLLDLFETASNNLELLDIGPVPTLPPKFDLKVLDGHSIKFSSLKLLSLDLGPEVLMAVLDHIEVPLDINWQIDCQDVLSRPSLGIPPLILFLRKARVGVYLLIKINCDKMQMDFARTSPDPYNATFKVTLPNNPNCIGRLEPLFNSLGLFEMCICNIICSSLLNNTSWREAYWRIFVFIFPHFYQLKRLTIACDNAQSLGPVITQLQPVMLMLPCPLLSHLSIGLMTAVGDGFMLVQILRHREAAGGVLQTLTVDYYYLRKIEEHYIREGLRKFAKEVKVHSVNPFYEDSIDLPPMPSYN